MARQVGPLFLEGTVDDLTFYYSGGKWLVRRKSSLNRKKFLRRPCFAHTRRNAAWFGLANKLAGAVYSCVLEPYRSRVFYNFLAARAQQLIRQGLEGPAVMARLVRYLRIVGISLNEERLAFFVHPEEEAAVMPERATKNIDRQYPDYLHQNRNCHDHLPKTIRTGILDGDRRAECLLPLPGYPLPLLQRGHRPFVLGQAVLFRVHLLTAILPLVLGPLQFWNAFRNRYTSWHRRLGKAYIIGSLLGGVTAFVLGVLQPYEGSIVPVVMLSLLWIFMTVASWITIRNRNIKAHRLFTIRSYALALTFVWLRILGDLVYKHNLLFFIKSEEIKDATYEWMSWVLPILLVELFISWIPSMKQKNFGKAA